MSAAQHFYQACGLLIASDAPIPGLRDVTGSLRSGGSSGPPSDPPDITFSMRDVPESRWTGAEMRSWWVSPELDARGRPEMTIEANDWGYRLTYDDNATFLIDRTGGRITAHWTRSISDLDVASHLAGSVLAFVLRLRGAVPLHASAIAVGGQALLFVGDPWAGKSSTVAAFSKLGYPLVADDIVRIDADTEAVLAHPGHPRLSLWSDSAATLLGTPNEEPAQGEEYLKQVLDFRATGRPFQARPLPIGAIYLLGDRLTECPCRSSIRPLSPSAALVALTRHTYGGCFLDRTMRAREFEVLCRLVERVLVRELRFADDLGKLVESCRALADDWVAGHGEGGPALQNV
jgi:hypothetical protein